MFLSGTASHRMHRTDYCIIQMEKPHFELEASSISSNQHSTSHKTQGKLSAQKSSHNYFL